MSESTAFLTEAVRVILEDTPFEHGAGNAGLLVNMAYSDWCAEKTHMDYSMGWTDEDGLPVANGIKTTEERAFNLLREYLQNGSR